MSLTYLWKDKVCAKYCTYCRFFLVYNLKNVWLKNYPKFQSSETKCSNFRAGPWGDAVSVTSPVSLWTTLVAVRVLADNCRGQRWSQGGHMPHIMEPNTVEVCLMASSGLMRTVTRWGRILPTTACVLFTRSKSALFCCPVERQLLQKGLALSPRSSTVCSFTQSLNIYLNLSPRIFKRVKAPLNTKQLWGVCKNNSRWTQSTSMCEVLQQNEH